MLDAKGRLDLYRTICGDQYCAIALPRGGTSYAARQSHAPLPGGTLLCAAGAQ